MLSCTRNERRYERSGSADDGFWRKREKCGALESGSMHAFSRRQRRRICRASADINRKSSRAVSDVDSGQAQVSDDTRALTRQHRVCISQQSLCLFTRSTSRVPLWKGHMQPLLGCLCLLHTSSSTLPAPLSTLEQSLIRTLPPKHALMRVSRSFFDLCPRQRAP